MLDDVSHDPIHGRGPDHQRAHRLRHRPRPRRQSRASAAALAALRSRRADRRRQYRQYYRRHRRHGRSGSAPRRRACRCLCAGARRDLPHRTDLHPLPLLRPVHEGVDAGAVCLCGGRIQRPAALGRSTQVHIHPARLRRARFHHHGGRGAGDDDQSLFVFLAGIAGSRGTPPQGGEEGGAAEQKPRGGAPALRADRDRHLDRHGAVEHRRLLHHRDHCRNAARSRHRQDRHRGPGRRGLAPLCRAGGVSVVFARHRRHRAIGDSGPRRLRRLRVRRDFRMEREPEPAAAARPRLLSDHRRRHLGRRASAP